jgi:probable HAF family extracellular repeat protein
VLETGQSDNPYRPSAYRWSSADGMVEVSQTRDAPLNLVDRISGDGSTIVGRGNVAGYRWTTSDGLLGAKQIGGRLDENTPEGTFQPEGLSFDGSVVVGGNTLNLRPNQPWNGQAARWTEATGVEYLGLPTETFSLATGVSHDGSVIVGYVNEFESPKEAFRWTAETGMIRLGLLPGWTDSLATAISGNGLVIIGRTESASNPGERQPFIWTADFGMRTLEDVLTERGLADEIAGWNLGLIDGVSVDGRFLIGNGRDPSGQSSPWLVDLGGFTPVPEPATYGAVSAMGLLALVVWRRRRCVAPADPLG